MNPSDAFAAFDAVDEVASFLAGIRQKFIDKGFSPSAAEDLTITLFSQQSGLTK